MTSAPLLAGSNGIDAIALGDVNGDQVADIAVASHNNGHEMVTIYGGNGQAASSATGFGASPLITLVDPLGPHSGPLSIALGDFMGLGTAQLAMAPSSKTTSETGRGIVSYSFTNNNFSPIGSPVSKVMMGASFVPTGMNTSSGFALAAGNMVGSATAELVVAPAAGSGTALEVESYQAATQSWQNTQMIGQIPVKTSQGLSIAVGDLTGDGVTDIAVGSRASGYVGLYSGKTSSWMKNRGPFGAGASQVNVAIVAGKNQAGALIATGLNAQKQEQVALWNWKTPTAHRTILASDPGAGQGALALASGGMVYQRSSANPLSLNSNGSVASGSFPTNSGPITPTVLFGSAVASTAFVVQGFAATGSPSIPDTFVEPVDPTSTQGFIPLQMATDPATTDTTPSTKSVLPNLVVVPANAGKSPYSVNLTAAPVGFDQGLWATTPFSSSSTSAWGPQRVKNNPPTITSTTTNDQLRERLLAAYVSVIGVDYQHHHTPLWQPRQGSTWNTVTTVPYQSQGIDCTNLTAWAYNDALGITIPSATPAQAALSAITPSGSSIPTSLQGHVTLTTIEKSAWTKTAAYDSVDPVVAQASYDKLVKLLMPGDILILDGAGRPGSSTTPTHAITWLGHYGVDSNNVDKNLIIDATGITPNHIDSNNHVVPEGVQIRPFGGPSSANNWYFTHVDHVLRFIDN